jgi:hypothetical protein
MKDKMTFEEKSMQLKRILSFGCWLAFALLLLLLLKSLFYSLILTIFYMVGVDFFMIASLTFPKKGEND